MSKPPVITGIEVHEFQFEVKNLSHSPEHGSLTYTPGKHGKLTHNALRILTDQGIGTEIVRETAPGVAKPSRPRGAVTV